MSWYDEISDLNLPDEFAKKCEAYSQLLMQYTKTHNITAFKNKEDILKNIADAVYPLRYIKTTPKYAADIGSGAGFPGLFLAMAMEDCHFSLYEPLKKKSAFLHWVLAKLQISNVSVKSIRVEDEKDKMYELITSRAVTKTQILVNLCENIYDENTTFLLYKGSQLDDEDYKQYKYKIYENNTRRYLFIKDIK